MASIEKLPDVLLLKIFSYLDFLHLVRVVRVCRRWNTLGFNPTLWKHVHFQGVSTDAVTKTMLLRRYVNPDTKSITFTNRRHLLAVDMTNKVLLKLLERCSAPDLPISGLTSLTLVNCVFSNAVDVFLLPDSLKHLTLQHCEARQYMDLPSYPAIGEKFPHLQSMNLRDSSFVTPRFLQSFSTACLSSLRLSGCFRIPISLVLQRFSALQTLEVDVDMVFCRSKAPQTQEEPISVTLRSGICGGHLKELCLVIRTWRRVEQQLIDWLKTVQLAGCSLKRLIVEWKVAGDESALLQALQSLSDVTLVTLLSQSGLLNVTKETQQSVTHEEKLEPMTKRMRYS